MQLVKAQSIEGWMTTAELTWLAEQAQKYCVIAELGSYCGRSTRAMGDHTFGVIYAIDNWYGPTGAGNSKPLPPELDSVGSSGVGWTEEERAQLYPKFCSNLQDLIEKGKVIPVKADHDKVELEIMFDFVFIDGDHSWEAVRRDLETWWPKVKQGGILSGHDASLASVIEPVREKFKDVQIVPNTTIWWVQK